MRRESFKFGLWVRLILEIFTVLQGVSPVPSCGQRFQSSHTESPNDAGYLKNANPSMTGYRQFSNIRRTQSQNINVSRLVLQLSFPNPLKLDVNLRMKMQLEQRRQAMLQLHLSDQQFYCLLRRVLYERLYGIFFVQNKFVILYESTYYSMQLNGMASLDTICF